MFASVSTDTEIITLGLSVYTNMSVRSVVRGLASLWMIIELCVYLIVSVLFVVQNCFCMYVII